MLNRLTDEQGICIILHGSSCGTKIYVYIFFVFTASLFPYIMLCPNLLMVQREKLTLT